MPKFLIHRNVPGASHLTAQEIHDMSKRFNVEVRNSTSPIYWVHTYVLQDEIFCVYIALNEQVLRAYCERAGYGCDTIQEVFMVIDPLAGMPENQFREAYYQPPAED